MAVDQVTVEMRPGESLGIVGESGSRKTTLARMLVGLETPESGSVLFDGREVTGFDAEARAAWRRDVQFVFQDNAAALDPRMTLGDSITESLAAQRLFPADRQDRLVAVMSEVRLDGHFAARRPHQLSGGQRQRAGIARALISNPRLIIAIMCRSHLPEAGETEAVLSNPQYSYTRTLLKAVSGQGRIA